MSKQDKKLFVKLLALLGTQILVPFAPPPPPPPTHYIPSVHLCMCAGGVCVCVYKVYNFMFIYYFDSLLYISVDLVMVSSPLSVRYWNDH